MSLLLAIETATELSSVALGDGESVLAEVVVGRRRTAATLVPSIESCLQLAGANWRDIGDLAVADGPGSFTGLRIGFATAQGLLAERKLRIHIVPSLMVSAWGAARSSEEPVAALYDALRGEVYGAVYSFVGAGVIVHVPPALTTIDGLREGCPVRPSVAVGDGALAFDREVREWTGREPIAMSRGAPRAAWLVGLVPITGAAVLVDSLTDFEPSYGRLPHAQVAWEHEHGRALDE